MPNRKWMPSHLQDEQVPPPRDSPSDWIIGPAGDCWLIAGDESADAEGRENSRRAIAPGETLDFDWNEAGEDFEALIRADGTFELPAGGEPPEATHYWIPYDSDTMAFSWKDFVAAQAQVASADGDLVEVEAYSWSEAPVPHRLVVENGAARFEPVEAEAAAHV